MAHIERRKLSDGTTAYRVVWTDPSGTRRRRQFSRAQTSRPAEEAKKFKTAVESELLRGTYVDPADGNVTFAEYYTSWRASQHLRPKTLDNLDSMMANHVLPLLGPLKIGAIQRRQIQNMVNVLLAKPVGGRRSGPRPSLSSRFVMNIYINTASVFRDAVLDKVIPASPCHRINLPDPQRREVMIPTPDQVARIADRVPPWNRGMILLGAGSGLRSGELRSLDLDRLRVLEREVRVDRSLADVTKDKQPVYGPPKTPASYRTVPVAPEWMEDVAVHLQRFGTGTDGLVFCARNGQPIRKDTLGMALSPVLRDMGFPVQSGMHLLRHYYVSSLIAGGEDIITVMRRVGHSSDETTRMYGHLWPEHEGRTRDASAAAHPTRQGVRRPLKGVPGGSHNA